MDTPQPVSPLERAKQAKAQAEERKQAEEARLLAEREAESARQEAERKTSEQKAEQAATERAEKISRAENEVAGLRETMTQKQAEYDEILQLSEEPGDEEYQATMQGIRSEALQGLTELQSAVQEAEKALSQLSPTKVEMEKESRPMTDVLNDAFKKTFGLLPDRTVNISEMSTTGVDFFAKQYQELIANAKKDPEGLEKLVVAIQKEVLPELKEIEGEPLLVDVSPRATLKRDMDAAMTSVENAVKVEFGITNIGALRDSPNVDRNKKIVDFIKNHPAMKKFVENADKIADFNLQKMAIGVSRLVRNNDVPRSYDSDRIIKAGENAISHIDDTGYVNFYLNQAVVTLQQTLVNSDIVNLMREVEKK